MELATARNATPLVAAIDNLQQMIDAVTLAKSEHWLVMTVIARAPETGSSSPAGTTVSLLTNSTLDDQTSQLTFDTALGIYQQQMSALTAQLAAL